MRSVHPNISAPGKKEMLEKERSGICDSNIIQPTCTEPVKRTAGRNEGNIKRILACTETQAQCEKKTMSITRPIFTDRRRR